MDGSSKKRVRRVSVALAAGLVMAVGCGSGGQAERGSTGDPVDAPCSLSIPIVPDPAGPSVVRSARSVEELLPNRLIEGVDGSFASISDSVVIGVPIEVEPGVASDWSAMVGDDESSAEVAFSDPQAETRTWLVTLAVEEVLGGADPVDGASSGEVTVSLPTWGGLPESEAFAAGLGALGRGVWFLRAGATHGLLRVPWDGGAVAVVDDGAALSFPLLPEARGAASWSETYTLDCLRTLAAQPDRRVPAPR